VLGSWLLAKEDGYVGVRIMEQESSHSLVLEYGPTEPTIVRDAVFSYVLARADKTRIKDHDQIEIDHNMKPNGRCQSFDTWRITFGGELVAWSTTFTCSRRRP
jgi:hypothetical protein